jgi:hypothetical protein
VHVRGWSLPRRHDAPVPYPACPFNATHVAALHHATSDGLHRFGYGDGVPPECHSVAVGLASNLKSGL